jgi:hypothetical protein
VTCGGTSPNEIGRQVGRSGKTVRAWLRRRWPDDAPGQGGDWYLRHDQVVETLLHFGSGGSSLVSGPKQRTSSLTGAQSTRTARGRAGSDESYVVDLIAELLEEQPLRQYRFDWLRGDARTKLPVDAYYPAHGLVVEFREHQHLADRPDRFKLWDNKGTASGVPRREQRKKYDRLREEVVPKHSGCFWSA